MRITPYWKSPNTLRVHSPKLVAVLSYKYTTDTASSPWYAPTSFLAHRSHASDSLLGCFFERLPEMLFHIVSNKCSTTRTGSSLSVQLLSMIRGVIPRFVVAFMYMDG